MKNFFRSFITSDRNNLSEQDQPESIELNEQELQSATGGWGDDCHHEHRHRRHDHDDYDYCDYDYCN